ncbi:sensor histidine kinase [Epilithonimonas sp.]|uniref:sensor histidine kinase n=1 Tax=Epilithonimonas sp. TaxID=2894511 RepID=UPI0035B3A749
MYLHKIKFFFLLKYARLEYIGVSKYNTEEVNLKTMFANRLILTYIVNQFVQVFLFISISYYISSLFCFFALLGTTFLYHFNAKRKYITAKIFILLYLDLIALLAFIYFSHPLLAYYYLPIIVASTMLFNPQEIKYLIIINVISISLMLLEGTAIGAFIPKMYADKNPETSKFIILYGNLSFIIGLIFMYIYYLNLKTKRLINLNKKLKESRMRMKEQSNDQILFSEASSHFLKSPIYIFNAFIDKIENGINENRSYKEMEQYFMLIKNSIDEEEKFINNMFDYNKIILTQAKKTDLKVLEVIKELLEKFKNAKPGFIYEIENYNETLIIRKDPELLEKIIIIIAENAYLYNNNAYKTLKITFENSEQSIKINFTDNGIGINTIYREKIFKPYIRLNTMENIPGTGIGLLKARKAAELINSELILLESSPYGSTFQLTINKHIPKYEN